MTMVYVAIEIEDPDKLRAFTYRMPEDSTDLDRVLECLELGAHPYVCGLNPVRPAESEIR